MDDQLADQINTASADSAPEMPDPLPTTVQLLCGLQGEDGWHDTAVVRELNGHDEEELAEIGAKDSVSYPEYMTAVLSRGVKAIGSIAASADVISQLILPDRDMLFLGIIRATYGDEREVVTTCQSCGAKNEIVLELENDFPIKRPDDPHFFRKPIELELRRGLVKLNYPTGATADYAVKHSKNTAHLDTLTIAQAVVTKDPDAPMEERIAWARDLNVHDRKKVEQALTESVAGMGPQLGEVETRCTECGAELPMLMDWVSLLLG